MKIYHKKAYFSTARVFGIEAKKILIDERAFDDRQHNLMKRETAVYVYRERLNFHELINSLAHLLQKSFLMTLDLCVDVATSTFFLHGKNYQ